MTIGKRIRKRRLELDLTQEELAERLNVSRVRITEWEGDKYNPKATMLLPLANALRMTVSDLIGEERRAV